LVKGPIGSSLVGAYAKLLEEGRHFKIMSSVFDQVIFQVKDHAQGNADILVLAKAQYPGGGGCLEGDIKNKTDNLFARLELIGCYL
jgi:hypothetical protein